MKISNEHSSGKFENLQKIIFSLQVNISNKNITGNIIDKEINELNFVLGFKYNDGFPRLHNTSRYKYIDHDVPENFAEAMLWKLGKWKAYRRYAQMYNKSELAEPGESGESGVVFYAFVKHLKDNSNPIYDQHALRALWSICPHLTAEEKEFCRSGLFKGSTWKPTISGSEASRCYELFVKHINLLMKDAHNITLWQLDQLLMPLGQAIKKIAKNDKDFQKLCDSSILKIE